MRAWCCSAGITLLLIILPALPAETGVVKKPAAAVAEPPWLDTLETACTRLIVDNRGNAGQIGYDSVNLDYMALGGDCTGDNDPDTVDDNAEIYLYDASPFICYVHEADTSCFYSMFAKPVTDSEAFVPLGGQFNTDSGGAQIIHTGTFLTADSLVAGAVTWYAPANDPDSCSFVIARIQFCLNSASSPGPSGVRLGMLLDWDIPADTGARNYDGFDVSLNLIYQQGSEEDGEGCQSNDTRWGGISYLDKYVNGVRTGPFGLQSPHGAYTKDNQTQVYPLGTFNEDSLFLHTSFSGYIESDTDNTDLHTVMTFDSLATLANGDTLEYYVLVASHLIGTLQDFKDEVIAGRAWYCNNLTKVGQDCGCCKGGPGEPVPLRGDADDDCTYGCVTVADLSTLVCALAFCIPPDPPPLPCCDEANVDGDCTFGCITVSDLSYLVSFLFQNGPPPLGCNEGDYCAGK